MLDRLKRGRALLVASHDVADLVSLREAWGYYAVWYAEDLTARLCLRPQLPIADVAWRLLPGGRLEGARRVLFVLRGSEDHAKGWPQLPRWRACD